MAGKRQWSIGNLMVIVLLAALDCGFFRAAYTHSDFSFWRWIALEVPMINILIFGFSRMRTKPGTRRFWQTFEIVGWSFTSILFALGCFNFDYACLPFNFYIDFLTLLTYSTSSFTQVVEIKLLGILLMYGVLPALAAAIVGWFRDGYRIRIAIVRRPRPDSIDILDPATQ
jgi:hypothetical protein